MQLAPLVDSDLDRIAAAVDARSGALPDGSAAGVRHLVDPECVSRGGIYYAMRPPAEAIEHLDVQSYIAAAERLRDRSSDLSLIALFDVAVDAFAATRRVIVQQDGGHRVAVNLCLTEPGQIAQIPVDYFDGPDKCEDLPRDGKRVADVWF